MNYLLLSLSVLFLISCGSSKKSTDTANVDREGIKKTIVSQHKAIRNCYGKELVKPGNEKLSGKLVLNFDINDSGKAENAKVVKDQTTLQQPTLSQCIMGLLATWQFPKPPEGEPVNVSYPFSFRDTPARDMQQKMDKFKSIKKTQ